MQLEQVELLQLENIRLRRETLAMQMAQLNAAEKQLALKVEERLGIKLSDYRLTPSGELKLNREVAKEVNYSPDEPCT